MNIDSTHIKTLVGSFNESAKESDPLFELQGTITQTRGISKKGIINDRKNLTYTISRALESASSFSGHEIDEVILSYTHPNITFLKKTVGLQDIKNKNGIYITEKWLETQEEKIKNRIHATHKHKRCAYFEIVSLLVDGEEVVYDPYELTATASLYITYTYILTPMAFIGTLIESVEQFTAIHTLHPAVVVNGKMLSDEEREHGIILCDIGPELTNVTVYKNGIIEGVRVFLFGDNTITNEIALLKKVSPEEAEQAKSDIKTEKTMLKKRDLQSIDKKIGLLLKKDLLPYIKEVDPTKKFPNGIMLLGKGSLYPGIEKVVEKITGLHTFHTKPSYHIQSQQRTAQIAWHTSYATLYSTATQQGKGATYRKKTSFFKKITAHLHTLTKIFR